jgi:hypothetical protein
MALILYKCDTCKREVGKPQNPKGLEIINRCVITLGCRGKLYQENVLEDFVRGELPADVIGLDSWQQRRMLYNHTQLKSESTWRIEHNLGTVPVVSIFVDSPTSEDNNNQIEVKPQDVIYVSSDITDIVFETPETGIAQLVARSSDPQLFQPSEVVTAVDTTTQVSSSGELTLATRVASSPPEKIHIQLMYTTPTGIEIPLTYTVDDSPAALSPWTSSNRVLIQGKLYKVRSFNPIKLATQTGAIPDGSSVRFLGYNPDVSHNDITPLSDDLVFILMASYPYASVDTIRDRIIDANDLSTTSATKQMVYTSGELAVTAASIQDVHPAIRSI